MENINLIEIKELIISTEKSKIYKSGIITDTYNKIFDRNEKPTNCGSCLRTFFLKIKNWYTEELKKQMEAETVETIEPVAKEDEILVDTPATEIVEDKVEVSPILTDNVIDEKPKSKGRKKSK